MAYIDVMSDASYGRFNRKLAKLTNLQCAVYWSELLDIIGHVIKKNSFVDGGYFTVDREYITARISLDLDTQRECDTILTKLGVLEVHPDNPDTIGVSCETMWQLLTETDTKVLKSISTAAKVTKADKAAGKRAGIINRLKDSLDETDTDLLQAYKDWIEVVYDKGVCKKVQVDEFIKSINNYSSKKEVKLWIIKKCTLLSYRDAAWGISLYEKETTKTTSHLGEQKIATSETVNSEIVF